MLTKLYQSGKYLGTNLVLLYQGKHQETTVLYNMYLIGVKIK